MNVFKNIYPVLLVLSLTSSGDVFAQGQPAEVAKIVSGLRSKNGETIEKAYLTLVGNTMRVPIKYRSNKEIRDGLWEALKYLLPEPVLLMTPGREESGIADWILFVVGDVKETRAIPYLIVNISNGGCQSSLARMGEDAVDPVLNVLNSGDERSRIGALETLRYMTNVRPKEKGALLVGPNRVVVKQTIINPDYGDYIASGKVKDKIKAALKRNIAVNAGKERVYALKAFRNVADNEDVPLLEEIAGTDVSIKRGRYIVRDAAKEVLKELKVKNDQNEVEKSSESASAQ